MPESISDNRKKKYEPKMVRGTVIAWKKDGTPQKIILDHPTTSPKDS